jgi:hypothetical protein
MVEILFIEVLKAFSLLLSSWVWVIPGRAFGGINMIYFHRFKPTGPEFRLLFLFLRISVGGFRAADLASGNAYM